jgi:hypothetical protein
VIARRASRILVPAAAFALLVALTGCGKAALGSGDGLGAGQGGSGGSASAAPTPAPDDSASLDAISQDLDSATAANTEAGSDATAGDQAASSSDEP